MWHKAAELLRQLPTRTAVQVESPTFTSTVTGWAVDKWQAEMMISRGWIPPEAERPAPSGDSMRRHQLLQRSLHVLQVLLYLHVFLSRHVDRTPPLGPCT